MVHAKETHADLINRLKDSGQADIYFSDVLKKCKSLDKSEADALLQEALKNLAQANPEDVHIDVNESNWKLSALLRFLHFISRKLV